MARSLNRQFNVCADEWPHLLHPYLTALVARMGIKWGETIVVAAHLQQTGVNSLPAAAVVNAAFSIAAVFI